MVVRPAVHTVLIGLLAIACDEGDTAQPVAVSDVSATQPIMMSTVSVDHLAVYQGVKVTLVDKGSKVAANAPVIPGRPAFVRVHLTQRDVAFDEVALARGISPRLVATLHVRAPGMPDVIVESGQQMLAPFADGLLSSTFNFEVEATRVKSGATLFVEIRDPSGKDGTVVRYPREGDPDLSMNTGTLEPKLKIRFVPIRYGADGSDRLPVVDAATIEGYRNAIYKLYPVAEVEASVREPLPWPVAVQPDGYGWDRLLDAMIKTRKDDQIADDVYYVGLVDPTSTVKEYCTRECILGVAPRTAGTDVGLRVALLLGYPTEYIHGTLSQELAHAMGRLHAPCGSPMELDVAYPYEGGGIGSWGWDIKDKKLVDPSSEVFDFMSYCRPVWVSDHTFAGLYERLIEVAATSATSSRTSTRAYRVGTDGMLRPGPMVDVLRPSSSGLETFIVESDAHRPIATVRGSFRPTSGIGGGLLLPSEEIPAAVLPRARFVRASAPIPGDPTKEK